MGGRLRAGRLAAVAGLLLLVACTGGEADGGRPSTSVPPTTAPERPPEAFYAEPDPLPPGPPGALIRALPIAGLSVLPDSRAWARGVPEVGSTLEQPGCDRRRWCTIACCRPVGGAGRLVVDSLALRRVLEARPVGTTDHGAGRRS
jgi:hypothetical protein